MKLKDTPANRKLLEAQAVLIDEEIKRGAFNYLKWFPHGNKAAFFDRQRAPARTVQEFYDQWIQDKKPPFVRKSRERDYRQHYERYLKSWFGPRALSSIGIADLTAFRSSTEGLKVKTVKNVLGGTLRALLRDAVNQDLITESPFDRLPARWWPETPPPGPNPFTWEEREQICKWFHDHDRHYWPFVTFHLWQSVRPSESTALTWGNIDRDLASIVRSRVRGEENAPKTSQARRVIHLKPHVAEILSLIMPLRVESNTRVFLNKLGQAINANEFRKNQWHRALRSLKIKPRDFYSTKDTAISLDLSAGLPAKLVAQEAGISVATLERHYGIYLERQVQPLVQPFLPGIRKQNHSSSLAVRPRRDLNPSAPDSPPDLKTAVNSSESSEISNSFPISPVSGKAKKRWVQRG